MFWRVNDEMELYWQEWLPETETKRTIFLLHGFGSCSDSFMFIGPKLAQQHQAQVIAWDRPAFGRTKRQKSYSKETLAYFTQEGLMELCLGFMNGTAKHNEWILCGNSLGGMVAMSLYLQAPEKITSLLLISPSIVDANPPGFVKYLAGAPVVSYLLAKSMSFISGPFSMAYFDYKKILEKQDLVNAYKEIPKQPYYGEGMVLFTRFNSNPDLMQSLDQFKCKILIITGQEDKIVPLAKTRVLEERLKQTNDKVQVSVIPECGHTAQEEHPDKVLEIIDAFLNPDMWNDPKVLYY